MCVECKDTGVVKTTAFDEQRIQAFCSCPIGRQKSAEYEANLKRVYTTSYDENELKKHDVGKGSSPSRIIVPGDSEINNAFRGIM
jgi:hypothetical protein